MNEDRFDEIRKVRQWLDHCRIEFAAEHLDYFGGYRLLAFTPAGEVSIICHEGSYGFPYGLLEYWDKKRMEDPVGWQSAEDVIAYIRKIMKGVKAMIPEFYEDWRKQADIQLEKDRQAAAAAEKKELLRDILLILAAPLAVAAVLAAPTICQAVFG